MREKTPPGAETEGATLMEVAEAILLTMLKKRDKDKHSDLGNPEGSMISSEWIDMRFDYGGRRRRLSVPTVVLRDGGRDFQLGYIYGTLAQKVRPNVRKCPDCGKLHEPTYGFSKGTLYRMDGGGRGGGLGPSGGAGRG